MNGFDDDDGEIRFRRHPGGRGGPDRFIRDVQGWFRRGAGSGRTIAMVAGALLLLLVLANTFYQVQPEEVGVVVRFGRYIRTSEPGLRVKLPFVEKVHLIPVQRQLKEEFGFRTTGTGAGRRSEYAPQAFAQEAVMLTGDLNVAVVEWIVQYRISDPYRYLFRVRNIPGTFRAMNEAVMRQVVGDRTVTEVLTIGRQAIEVRVEELLEALVQEYEMGLTIEQVVLQDVNPPDPVKPSWDEVNQAQQQRDRMINEARAEYNKVIPNARGEAERTVLEAEGYALNRVNRAQGESARFRSLHEAYRRAPDVTRRRLYLETMERVLPQTGGRLIVDPDTRGIIPLLPLDRLRGAGASTGQPAAPAQGGQR